jgi:hypothetical protein
MASTPQSFSDTPLNDYHPLGVTAPQTPTTPCHSFSVHNPGCSSPLLPLQAQDKGDADFFAEDIVSSPRSKKRARYIRPALLSLSVVLAVVVAFMLVYFLVIRRPTKGHQPPLTGSSSNVRSTWGGNGSTITTSDGSTFTYFNPFGGYCKCCCVLPRRTSEGFPAFLVPSVSHATMLMHSQ